jgi:hypothetical protein
MSFINIFATLRKGKFCYKIGKSLRLFLLNFNAFWNLCFLHFGKNHLFWKSSEYGGARQLASMVDVNRRQGYN